MDRRSLLTWSAILTAVVLVLVGGWFGGLFGSSGSTAAPTPKATVASTPQATTSAPKATVVNATQPPATTNVAQPAGTSAAPSTGTNVAQPATTNVAQPATTNVAQPATTNVAQPTIAQSQTNPTSYPISAADATKLALAAVPGATVPTTATTSLVQFQGVIAYEVSLDVGFAYVDATTGQVLSAPTTGTGATGGEGGEGGEGREGGEGGEGREGGEGGGNR